jgi:NADH-quinone oxidoreductase subunit J
MLDKVLFYFFSSLAVISAILVVTRRSAVHSAIFLITSLLATAGIFLQLRAEFLFIVQIILYAGGIMVLFVFVIMLVNMDVMLHQVRFTRQKWVALLLTVALGSLVAVWMYSAKHGSRASVLNLPPAPAARLEPNTQRISEGLFHDYILPFELASILLLVAMIGAVVMAKKKV